MTNSSNAQHNIATANVRMVMRGDIQRLIEIAAQAQTAAQWDAAEYEKLLAADVVIPRTTLVIEQSGKPAGFLVGKSIGDEWEVENIAVAQQMQHRGLGKSLLSEFLELVRRQKGRQIFLEVRESNLAARALYRKCGFKEAGRRKNYYENPPEDALILRFIFSI